MTPNEKIVLQENKPVFLKLLRLFFENEFSVQKYVDKRTGGRIVDLFEEFVDDVLDDESEDTPDE